MAYKNFTLYEISGRLVHVTEKAYLIEIEGQQAWFPKSQLRQARRTKDILSCHCPAWLLVDKGLKLDPEAEVIQGGTVREWDEVGESPWDEWDGSDGFEF